MRTNLPAPSLSSPIEPPSTPLIVATPVPSTSMVVEAPASVRLALMVRFEPVATVIAVAEVPEMVSV